jgi:hypothetical protein
MFWFKMYNAIDRSGAIPVPVHIKHISSSIFSGRVNLPMGMVKLSLEPGFI